MRVKLKDAFNLQMGKTPSRADLSLWGGNNKWISIADIGSAKKHISSTKECITDEGVSRSGIKVVPEGTVIMSFKLSIGKTAIVSEDMYTNEAIMAFIDNGTYCIDPNYLYHLCCGTDWTQGGNKAVMGLTLNKATLSEMEIELPTIEEQREIASILDQLDAIIEKRHDELNMIEQLVKSRFIELFGDPKSNPNGYPKKQLGKSCKVTTGNTPSRAVAEYYGDHIEWIKTDNIVSGLLNPTTATEYLSEKGMSVSRTVESGAILMACIAGSVSSIGRVCVTNRKVAFNQQINAIVPYDYNILFLYAMLQISKEYLVDGINMALKGILSKSKLEEKTFFVPPIELQEQFATFVEQTGKSKLAVQNALEELEILKKSLMKQYFG